MLLSRNWFRLWESRAGSLLRLTDPGSVSARQQLRTYNQTGLNPELLEEGFKAQEHSPPLAGTHKQLVCLREARPKFAKSTDPPHTELQERAHVALLPPGIKKDSYLMMAVSPWRMVMLSVVRCISTLRTGNPVGRRQSSLKKEACSCLQHDLRPRSISKVNKSASRL